MKTVNLLATLIISVSMTSFIACTTDNFTGTDAALSATANDEAQAASLSDEVVSDADFYSNTAASSGYMAVKSAEAAAGPTVTVTPKDSVTFPKTITINFGTEGIEGRRGNTLKGKLIVVITDRLWKVNSSKTITFDNFYVNQNEITGTKTVTYKGLNAEKNPYSIISVKDTITRADGTQVIWNSERMRERIDNGGTPFNFIDDKYSITGSSSGINAKGVVYIMVIEPTNPLIALSNYRHFVQGSVTITTEKRTALLDYGDGTKDEKATVTINGVTKEIKLRN